MQSDAKRRHSKACFREYSSSDMAHCPQKADATIAQHRASCRWSMPQKTEENHRHSAMPTAPLWLLNGAADLQTRAGVTPRMAAVTGESERNIVTRLALPSECSRRCWIA
jgi:hypothetical protein